MMELCVYHVVTERPLAIGQRIVFNGDNPNGVYRRVMTCKGIIDGVDMKGELADFIKLDVKKWASVMYRELYLEKVRQNEYPNYPSRMACLYTSRTLDDAKNWADYFIKIGRQVYSIVKLKVVGNIFDGDACNCFDGTANEADGLEKSRHYWRLDIKNERPVMETLVDGEITVIEVIEQYIK